MPRIAASAALAAALLLLSVGCSPISRELRRDAEGAPGFEQVRRNPLAESGRTFIWGGWIVETVNRAAGSDLVILQTPLDGSDRPTDSTASQGRFIARTDRFLDPAIYNRGRPVTVAGTLVGRETRAVGQTTYDYPVLEARQIYLWPTSERPASRVNFGVGFGLGYVFH